MFTVSDFKRLQIFLESLFFCTDGTDKNLKTIKLKQMCDFTFFTPKNNILQRLALSHVGV